MSLEQSHESVGSLIGGKLLEQFKTQVSLMASVRHVRLCVGFQIRDIGNDEELEGIRRKVERSFRWL
jgi:hypothetical protein